MLMYLWLIVGFVFLIKGADFFVEGSSSVAKLLKIPTIIIGLTIVAFGTSMPEASVSITAAMAGKNELSLSNVIGSNIFNLLVVAGASAVLRPIHVENSVLKKDFPFSIFITLVVLIMCIPGKFHGSKLSVLTQTEGVILLLLFAFYLYWTVRHALRARQWMAEDSEPRILSPLWTILYIILGLAGIIWGGNLVVDSATDIAQAFGLSETFIGLTIVALGTSLPELVTSIVAARKGESDIAMGNVIGSNIFNLLLVLGASCTLHPVAVNLFSVYDIIVLMAVSIFTYIFALHKKTLSKKEGALMLPMYLAFFCFISFR
ncbi:calcium/sodium antiporter [Lactonifactor longoviformis]|uniref:Cation:H+ antiporter n=2 Tax=Lactonifactor TaxID=420345 RepID=A0A1M4WL45_9CLOT|nr:calcium/sodium antiporter [Lactonifactor longoviformis]SHE81880.1 cation:H+ antiporter [Lactonifactor longoviformis DSM 17459]